MKSANLEIPTGLVRKLLAQNTGSPENLPSGSCLYGLYDDGDGSQISLGEAQQLLLALFETRILEKSDSHSKLLLVGKSMPLLADSLRATGRGVSVVNTASDSGTDHSGAGNIFDLKDQAGFDLVFIEGSIQYLDQLALLDHCRKLLKADGNLFVVSEFIDDDSKIEKATLPNLSSFRQLSQRLGFVVDYEDEFGRHATESLQSLGKMLDQEGEALFSSLANPSVSLDELKQDVAVILNEFETGRRCFRLFEFQYVMDAKDHYAGTQYSANGSFGPEDIAELFEASFDSPLDFELWRWKYELGGGKSVIAKTRGSHEIVSHYGGAPRDIYYFGARSKGIQVGDVMVLPSIRRSYGKSSLFFKTAATFLEREIGNTVNHLLGFGFPNQKAMNIAIRLGLYEKTDDFVELQISPDSPAPLVQYDLTSFDPDSIEHQQLLERLWLEMRDECKNYIVGVRDWEYFRYRYIQHPGFSRGDYRYRILSAQNQPEDSAIVVLKNHGEHELLMDIIAAPGALNDKLHGLNALLLNSASAKPLKFWITKAWIERLNLVGIVEHDLGIEIPCNSWNRGPSAETLYGAWWLTAGDMDFM